MVCGVSFAVPFREGVCGEGIDENSVADGDGLPQPKNAAKGDVVPLGLFGKGLLSWPDDGDSVSPPADAF